MPANRQWIQVVLATRNVSDLIIQIEDWLISMQNELTIVTYNESLNVSEQDCIKLLAQTTGR